MLVSSIGYMDSIKRAASVQTTNKNIKKTNGFGQFENKGTFVSADENSAVKSAVKAFMSFFNRNNEVQAASRRFSKTV